MHGRGNGWVSGPGWAALVLLAGCAEGTPVPSAGDSNPAAVSSAEVESAAVGRVQGQVLWAGEPPVVPPVQVPSYPPFPIGMPDQKERPNPNQPAIDPTTRGVAGAVVFLRGVPPRPSMPWPHAPVRVEQRGQMLRICQGGREANTGFVRRGDAIEAVAHDPGFHALQARGAAFFTLGFPEPGGAVRRRLDGKGVVELSSAAGHYWMRAYLFVDDHPFYTHTDAAGRFVLEDVPGGRWELVCWLPSGVPERYQRATEPGMVTRLQFRRPLERVTEAVVRAGQTHASTFVIRLEDFEPPPKP